MTNTFDIVNPGAASMIESLRAYGYSLNTAIADLIDNSISAGACNIWIHLHWRGDLSWISIADDGSGMDEDFLTNRLFKPFESTKSSMGMGIGAYQVREFIQAMGGAILVASEVNIGTSVSITLPIAYAES